MGIVIDIANPETDVEDVRTAVDRMVDDDVLESMHSLFQYGFGETDTINDEDIETLLEYGDENGLVSDVDTVDSFRDELEAQREQLLSHGGAFNQMTSHLLDVTDYVLIGENRKDALAAQREGISRDWDMTLTIPVV